MSLVYTVGRVTADIQLQTSTNSMPYLRFDLAEHIGYGNSTKTQYLQVWVWGDDAVRLVKKNVQKGSLIWISGSLTIEEYQKKNSTTTDKRLKVILDNWDYLPVASAYIKDKSDPDTSILSSSNHAKNCVIDGDREKLPN